VKIAAAVLALAGVVVDAIERCPSVIDGSVSTGEMERFAAPKAGILGKK
jgi:hypothetical protein